MNVSMTTDNTANYFNVLPPGSEDVAIFIGSTSGDNWTGTLEAGGDYKVRVYLMRSAARRNESARYTITLGITGSGVASATPEGVESSDARVEGTPYHATGQVPCSMGDAPSGSEQCAFGVIRKGPGSAEVHVTPPGGFERVLIFIDDKVSATEGSSVKSSKSGDMWSLEVNDYEHYQIPEAVISGG
jgi:hypothetical protein